MKKLRHPLQWRYFLVLVSLLSIYVFFASSKIAQANCSCSNAFGASRCLEGSYTSDTCGSACRGLNFSYSAVSNCSTTSIVDNAETKSAQQIRESPGFIGGLVLDAFKWLLYGVFVFVSWLMGVAAILLGWVIKTENVKLVLDNTAIYESWKMVRDFLNLAFILVLLFSAFCTIFQVEKYHLKKILLTLVIMALLVNFSFPVSRFIIDVSNVAFYFIINSVFPNMQGGEGIFSSIASHAGIADILKPKTSQVKDADVWYLIAIIVFTFILMITFLVIAVMFVIRLVALGILIIFSPVGFVAAIFPSTKHYADDWWGNLFKYSFFAPLMMFMLAIALNILKVMKDGGVDASFFQVSQNNIGGSIVDPNTVGKMAFFAIPIVILWAGLITAQKLSIAGAGVVTNQAKKFAGWARKKFSGYNMAKRQVDAFRASRKKREEEKAKTRVGGRIGSWINQKQDAAMGIISPKAKKRAEKMRIDANKKDIDEGAKDLIDKGGDAHTLGHSMNSDFSKKTNKKDILEQAKQATAYKRQDYNEKRGFVKSVVHDASLAGRNRLDNIVNISADDIGLDSASTDPAMIAKVAAYNAEQTAIQMHITAAKGGAVLSPDHLDEVTAFVNKQMGRKIKIGTDAK